MNMNSLASTRAPNTNLTAEQARIQCELAICHAVNNARRQREHIQRELVARLKLESLKESQPDCVCGRTSVAHIVQTYLPKENQTQTRPKQTQARQTHITTRTGFSKSALAAFERLGTKNGLRRKRWGFRKSAKVAPMAIVP